MTQMTRELAVEQADQAQNSFGFNFDGAYAADDLRRQMLLTPEQAAAEFLTQPDRLITSGPFNDFYKVYDHADTPERFNEMAGTLDGRLVLTPQLGADKRPFVAPAIVTDGRDGTVTMTILGEQAKYDPRTKMVAEDQRLMLAGAVQAANPRVGEHGQLSNSVEAGHFMAVMSGALRPDLGARIEQSDHIVHDIKARKQNLVASFSGQAVVGRQLFETPITTRTFTHATTPRGLLLLWPSKLERPDSADVANALPLLQGIGFMALSKVGAIDTAKRLAARVN